MKLSKKIKKTSKPIKQTNKKDKLSFNVDCNRTIIITGDITREVAGEVIFRLERFANTSKKPVHLFISTQGGCILSALAISDTLQQLSKRGVPVHTHVVGLCMSAGVTIFLAGNIRTATKDSLFMIHTVRESTIPSTPGMLSDTYKTNKLVEDLMIKQFSQLTTIDKAYPAWKEEFLYKDIFFFTTDAIKYGFVNAY